MIYQSSCSHPNSKLVSYLIDRATSQSLMHTNSDTVNMMHVRVCVKHFLIPIGYRYTNLSKWRNSTRQTHTHNIIMKLSHSAGCIAIPMLCGNTYMLAHHHHYYRALVASPTIASQNSFRMKESVYTHRRETRKAHQINALLWVCSVQRRTETRNVRNQIYDIARALEPCELSE